ncbi:MAG: DUF2029 domain-containing protein [Acidobacteriaceae bacterium]|nr:DUF2029 domain-containing protein [Acidobacteriaceae bacterium]
MPANTQVAQAKAVPIGNNSDLYPRWLGARELLLHHRDPYSPEVTREIQRGFYGREIDPGNPNDPHDQAAFAYPVYVVFVLAPFVRSSFGTVQAIFRWVLLFGIALTIPAWMYAIGLRKSPAWTLSAAVLTISTYPAMLEFYMQNLAGLVAVLLAFSAAAAARRWFALSGFLLALATIKPQLSGLFVLCFLVWASGSWSRRKRLVASFATTLVALAVAGQILLPHWISEFLAAAQEYSSYASDPSILRFAFGPVLSWLAVAVMCMGVVLVALRYRNCAEGSTEFGYLLAAAATVTLAILPVTVYNQVLLVPALLTLSPNIQISSGLLPRALAKASFACLGWQWLTAASLGLCSVVIAPERLHIAVKFPLLTLIALPPVALLAVAAGIISLQSTSPIPQLLAVSRE